MKEEIYNNFKFFLDKTNDKEISLELLKELGINLREQNRQGASKILLKSPELATEPQKSYLKSLGYKGNLNTITRADANKEIQNLVNIKSEGYL